MTEALLARIRALDDKQAIFVVNNLVQAVFSTSPELRNLSDDQQIALVEADVAREIGRALPPIGDDAAVPAEEAGEVARNTLTALAATPDGDHIVTYALETWYDKMADFGLLSVSVAIAAAWLIAATEVKFSIGDFHFVKYGMTGKQQVDLAKLLAAILRLNPGDL